MPESLLQIPKDVWPENGLERVTACPACSSNDRTVMYEKLEDRTFFCAPGQWTLQRCKVCGTAYLDPRPTPSTIGNAYARYYTHSAPPDWLNRLPKQIRDQIVQLCNGFLNTHFGYTIQPSIAAGSWIVPLIPWLRYRVELSIRHMARPDLGAQLLDVGCGGGEYLEKMRALGWQVNGLEPDPIACTLAQNRGLNVIQGTLDTIKTQSGSYDVITLNHVVEHLHSPLTDLSICLNLLKPGGVLWLATPNLDAFGHAFYGSHWRGLEVPRHLVMFSTRTLVSVLRRLGFDLLPWPHQSVIAENSFRLSRAIRYGLGIDNPPRLPPLEFALAILADAMSFAIPHRAEHTILVARKPLEKRYD